MLFYQILVYYTWKSIKYQLQPGIIQKHGTVFDNPPIRIYVIKIM